MKGIAKHTERIIEPVSKLDCLKGWTLAGGTALAIQLGHRLSEIWISCAGRPAGTNGWMWTGRQPQAVGIGRRGTVDGYSRPQPRRIYRVESEALLLCPGE